MKKIVNKIFFISALFFSLSFSAHAEFICGADLNNNGSLSDKGELQGCWTTEDNNYLCPIVTGGCTAAYSNPICSDGGTLNTSTDQCELASTGISCSSGYTYDSATAQCIANATCLASGSLDTNKDVCYKAPTCPMGYIYSYIYKACIKSPTCPSGGYYNNTYDRCIASVSYTCPSGYSWQNYWNGSGFSSGCLKNYCYDPGGYNPQITYGSGYPYGSVCYIWPTKSCNAGYTLGLVYDPWLDSDVYVCTAPKTYCDSGIYNSSSNKCEMDITTFVPEGYVYDSTKGAYLGDPSCPSGTIYNTVTNLCEATPSSVTCPTGYTLNSDSTGCEAAKCPDGQWGCYGGGDGIYGESCFTSPITDCAQGYTFYGGYCSTNPICGQDEAYDPAVNGCVYQATYGCPAGYVYNTSVGKCQRDPVCTADTSYDTFQNICITADPVAGVCPLGGAYPCDASGNCVKTYPCNTGFQTMEICQQNCDGTCTSSCNTDAISAFGDVFWTGSVPGYSWFGITGVTGSVDQLVIYGKNVSNDSDLEVGRITMSGCTFSGSVSYYTRTGDSCSSTSWGLSSVSANGNDLSFSGGECGTPVGSITVSGCYIQIPSSSSSFDITRIVGNGSSLTFYGGLSGNQQIVSISLCQYSYTCSACQVTKACTYSCPDPSYQLLSDYRCSTYATCPDSGALSAALDKCEIVAISQCPEGYTFTDNKCVKAPTCPAGTTFNPTADKCQTLSGISCPNRPAGYNQDEQAYTYNPAASGCYFNTTTTPTTNLICPGNTSTTTIAPTNGCSSNKCNTPFLSGLCPSGTNLNTVTAKCEGAPTGYGALDTNLDKFVYYATVSCPDGSWTVSGSKCQKDPTCQGAGTWNSSLNACSDEVLYNCPTGYTYVAYYGRCERAVECQEGVDQIYFGYGCVNPNVTYTCPLDYSYDTTISYCTTEAKCEVGILDPALNKCKVTDNICPAGYWPSTYNYSRCDSNPVCQDPGSYSNSIDKCISQPIYNCPATYTYLNGTCYKLPDCPNGTYEPSNDQCYNGGTQCSLGNYPCYVYNGQSLCSPYTCEDSSNPTGVTTNTADLTSPEDNGTVNESGQCSGQFYIFSGTGNECRPVGTQTGFNNCCNLATAQAGKCATDGSETLTDTRVTNGLCHYVGTYCAEDWALVGCVQSKKTYCCFNSKLSRIINEQGRSQLLAFTSISDGVWGSPENPECRGFTPEEFQMLDFSKMDLSEFFNEVINDATNATQNLQQNMSDKVNNFYNDMVQ